MDCLIKGISRDNKNELSDYFEEVVGMRCNCLDGMLYHFDTVEDAVANVRKKRLLFDEKWMLR
jgi:chaperone required for assembly of F1-ATPase